MGGIKYNGVGKIDNFNGNHHLSQKRCEIGRWLLQNVNRKSWVPNMWNVTRFGDLDWPVNASLGFVGISWPSCWY